MKTCRRFLPFFVEMLKGMVHAALADEQIAISQLGRAKAGRLPRATFTGLLSAITGADAPRSASCVRAKWPPDIWPVSCAITPMTWFGLSAAISLGGKADISDVEVLVNCTPVGMHPNVDESPIAKSHLKPTMIVFDTVYNPESTLLLKEAREKGCKIVTGVEMFIRQAALQFLLFTGQEAPEALISRPDSK